MEGENKQQGLSLKDSLASIAESLEELKEQKKVKEWKLPFLSRLLGKRKKRKGYVLFQNIGLNKAVTFIKAPVEEGVALVNGVPHVVNAEDILIWKNKIPMVIQPQWSERPFSMKDHYNETAKNGAGSEGWKLIMNYIYSHKLEEKKSLSIGAIIIGIMVILGLGYYLLKSGVF